MATIDKKYHKLLKTILKDGRWYDDPNRKGVKRLQIPHYSFTYNLKDGFPAITTKKLYWKGIVGELLWFLKGDTNIKYLIDNGINIWNKDAYNYYCKRFLQIHPGFKQNMFDLEHFIELIKTKDLNYLKNIQNLGNNYKLGDLGRIYGAQWRNFTVHNVGPNDSFPIYVDQIQKLIQNLKEKPLATDHIVTAWNPAELDQMALPPCHKGFQLMVYELSPLECTKYADKSKIPYKGPKYGFDLVWEQRSVDTFLGLPFNIASYALLAHIIGEMVNMIPGKIYGDLRNVHIYDNAIDGVKEQLSKDINKYDKCKLNISSEIKNILSGKIKNQNIDLDTILNNIGIPDFQLENYKSYDSIKTEMLNRDE